MTEELKIVIEMLNGLGAGAYSGFIIWIVFSFLKLAAVLGTILLCFRGLLKCLQGANVLRRGFIELHNSLEYPDKDHLCSMEGDLNTPEMTKMVAHILTTASKEKS